MFKKVFALILAVALVASAWIIPTQAASVPTADVMDITFDGEVTDATGQLTTAEGITATCLTSDSQLGHKVLSLIGSPQYKLKTSYDTKALVTEDWTIESYVKIIGDEDCRLWTFTNCGYGGVNAISLYEDGFDFFGFGYEDATLGGDSIDLAVKTSMTRQKWVHVCQVHDKTNGKVQVYVNGVLIKEANKVNSGDGMSSGTTYLGCWTQGCNAYMDFFRVYSKAVTAEEASALYSQATGQSPATSTASSGSATPTPASVTPTPGPTATPAIVPTGSAYTTEIEDVPAFKAGDTVNIKLHAKAKAANGIMGFDISLAYDTTVLDAGEELDTDNWESNVSEINAKYEGAKWTVNARYDSDADHDKYIQITLLEDNAETVVKDGDDFWVVIPFTALQDGTAGNISATVFAADGTSLDDDGIMPVSVEGSGTNGYIVASTDVTPTPSESATASPSSSSSTDTDHGNPSTFDPGLISLAAMALTGIVAVKRRKK